MIIAITILTLAWLPTMWAMGFVIHTQRLRLATLERELKWARRRLHLAETPSLTHQQRLIKEHLLRNDH
jgi:hypothetical protein